jgi:hypothetical protein
MKARQDDTPHLGEEESIILDMSKKKTELTLKAVKTILHEQFAVEAGNVRQLIEGEVSQAFSFECAEIGYVIRIGKAIEGFSILDPRSYSWDRVIHHLDRSLLKELITAFTSLAKHCPEERYLVHGDFGSNNVLTDGRSITAVLDWDEAKYGDPLFDVATAYFWSSWLDCMAAQAAYYNACLSAIPGYQERIVCYQLRIGLAEVYDNVMHQNWKMARWAAKRSAEIALLAHTEHS